MNLRTNCDVVDPQRFDLFTWVPRETSAKLSMILSHNGVICSIQLLCHFSFLILPKCPNIEVIDELIQIQSDLIKKLSRRDPTLIAGPHKISFVVIAFYTLDPMGLRMVWKGWTMNFEFFQS